MMKRKIRTELQKLNMLPLPSKEKILAACGEGVSDTNRRESKGTLGRLWRRPAVLAIVAVLLIGSGITVAAAETTEYREAVDFFETNHLSTEGFTRGQIKKIYRDISTRQFRYDMTESALLSGLEGYEIESDLTPEELERLWLACYGDTRSSVDAGSGEITYSYVHKINEELSFLYDDEISVLVNGKWERSFHVKGIYLDVLCKVGEDRLLLIGSRMENGRVENDASLIARLIDPAQPEKIVWEANFENGSDSNATAAYSDGNRTCVVSDGRKENDRFFCITELGENGAVEKQLTIPVTENSRVLQIIPLEDAYLLRRVIYSTSLQEDDTYELLRVDADGSVRNSTVYGGDGEHYEITNMTLYNGKVYLSGRMVSDAIAGVFTYQDSFEQLYGKKATTDEECLNFLRENHTAVLLVCDSDGAPQEFYSVSGATGGGLEVVNGQLCWEVGRYVSAELCDDTKMYLTYATVAVSQFAFNPYGQLISENVLRYDSLEY